MHDLNATIVKWSRELPPDIGLVVGVPRSGMLAASLLALHIHRPLLDLSAFISGAQPWTGLRHDGSAKGRVLVLDDTVNSGTEMRRVKDAVASMRMQSADLLFAAVFASPDGARHVNEYAEILPTPRAFEWNILNHKELLAKACMDIDGVLCPDPLDDENDDGPRYRAFLSDAELRYKPGTRVDTLVTSRLEKYRPETEEWLQRNGIEYNNLLMLDLPSAVERRKLNAHVPHKATAYLNTGNEIFIESSEEQARAIFELTGKPVFATDTRDFFGPGANSAFKERVSRRAADGTRGAFRKLRRLIAGPKA